MDRLQIRRAQTITPFGVGSVLDIEGQSLVAADITFWKGQGEPIYEERLERHLGVSQFRIAPAAPQFHWEINEHSEAVPYVRFPTWYFCSNCRTMYHRFSQKNPPVCSICHGQPELTPMRFVTACPCGHLDDVPWDYWAHSRQSKCGDPKLAFLTTPGGSGLEFVYVKCRNCGARRSLEGIANPDSLQRLGVRCRGHHPWIPYEERDKNCDAVPQVIQRGATNLTFSIIESSIDIPPHSSHSYYSDDSRKVTNHPLFPALQNAWQHEQNDFFDQAISMIADQLNLDKESVRRFVFQALDEEPDSGGHYDQETLHVEEYEALTATGVEYDPEDRFIKRDVDLSDIVLNSYESELKGAVEHLVNKLGKLSQITKLREVRVLRGFSRLSPPSDLIDPDEEQPGRFSTYSGKKVYPIIVRSDLGKMQGGDRWLPAIQVFGEGVFISFDEDSIQAWESRSDVRNRLIKLAERSRENASYLPEPTPRFVLLHTLSHILIRQLSFECGYSISSLRERIYSATPDDDQKGMAGILIYTASGDSEGTMGGLVRMGEGQRWLSVFLKALQAADWCSSDPLCRESSGQGLYSLNLAACHSCSLLPETSCVHSNRLLDRIMIYGNDSVQGYFTDLMNQITSKSMVE